jgi:putative protease
MSLFDKDEKISDYFSMSAKDMCLIDYIEEYIKNGVASFKVEGRMKNEHYVATVAKDYQSAITDFYNDTLTNSRVADLKHDLESVANRETSYA